LLRTEATYGGKAPRCEGNASKKFMVRNRLAEPSAEMELQTALSAARQPRANSAYYCTDMPG